MAYNSFYHAILTGGMGPRGGSGAPQGEHGGVGHAAMLNLAHGQRLPFAHIQGGQGGAGGAGTIRGGDGGLGEAPQVFYGNMPAFLSHQPERNVAPVPVQESAGGMDMSKPMVVFLAHSDRDQAAVYQGADTFPSLDEFCARYPVSGDAKARLAQLEDGVSSVVGLLGVTGDELQGAGFSEGQVAQLGESLRSLLGDVGLLAPSTNYSR